MNKLTDDEKDKFQRVIGQVEDNEFYKPSLGKVCCEIGRRNDVDFIKGYNSDGKLCSEITNWKECTNSIGCRFDDWSSPAKCKSTCNFIYKEPYKHNYKENGEYVVFDKEKHTIDNIGRLCRDWKSTIKCKILVILLIKNLIIKIIKMGEKILYLIKVKIL